METIFDHNITKEEYINISGCQDKEFYLKYLDQESAYCHIAMLYHHRKNYAMYKKYLDKLSVDMREACIRTVTHT